MSSVLLLVVVLICIAVFVVGLVMLSSQLDKRKKLRLEAKKQQRQQELTSRAEIELAERKFAVSKLLSFGDNHIAIDVSAKTVGFVSGSFVRIVGYSDIISFEVVEDGQAITDGSSNALVGGLLFGVTGAVVGASMKKQEAVCQTMQLRVTVSDVISPSIVMGLITKGVYKTSEKYKEAFMWIKDVCETLAAVRSQK